MPEQFKNPGIYIEEIPKLPPSIISVQTAIPAFIGYTEISYSEQTDFQFKPKRIDSLVEYQQYFGFADPERESIEIVIDDSMGKPIARASLDESKRSKFLMYYSLQMFFQNGGGACWIVSVGNYKDSGHEILYADLQKGLSESSKIDEVTLLIFPDALNISDAGQYYELMSEALSQCHSLQDRFSVFDIYRAAENANNWQADINFFRNNFVASYDTLKYAAVYFPRIYAIIDFLVNEEEVYIKGIAKGKSRLSLKQLESFNKNLYLLAKSALEKLEMLLPVCPAIAGIYTHVDKSRGVWKSPANINIRGAVRPEILIDNDQQNDLNVDVGGKSINVIRSFPGRGSAIVWGARTLAGNDNEWRYIPVRRFFIMVEESVKNAVQQFVFEPNDRNTWTRIKSMIENYLTQLWKAGALQGTTNRESFFVHVGLGETMTQQDISEGRLVGEIGMAVVRPAEFIIFTFMIKMQED